MLFKNPFREMDQEKLKRSSDLLMIQNNYLKIVNRRIIIMAVIVIVLFALVIVRLFYIQVYEHENYKVKLANYSSQEQRSLVPRGAIYDRNGNILVKSVSSLNITYFPPKNVTNDEKWELAKKFSKKFKYDYEKLNTSDLQDLYLFLYRDAQGNMSDGSHLLTQEELASITTSSEKDALIRDKISEDMVNEIASEDDKKAFSIYLSMNKLPTAQSKVIVEDASNDDVAYLMEHKDEYRGFDVDFTSWKREYPYKNTLRDVLGSVSSTKQGVPFEEREYYEALGYSLTDRVGISGIEKQYESLLAGTPKIEEISYGSDGNVLLNEIQPGKKGYDLHMTIDIDLQQKADAIVEDVVKQYGGTAGREAFNQAFVLLINPKTGEIYSMSGALKNKDKSITKFASGTYLNTYQVGSVVKGATVYMMLSEGIQTRNSTENDVAMNIGGMIKSSYMDQGIVNAIRALEVSSNVYMWKSVIKLAGGTYVPGQSLNISLDKAQNTLTLMRQYYSMFGLGTKTGLDVPNEAMGVTSDLKLVGNLLDYSIGQFETYSPIQLAQYVSTIANGGYKIQPKLVNYATEINSDYKIYENKTTVLSKISGKKDDLITVRDGFRACITGNHCGLELNMMDEGLASKTGTAQVIVVGEHAGNYTNSTQIGFAPYDDPDVAFVCSAPTSAHDESNAASNLCTTDILPRVLKEFFKKY